MKVKAFSRTYTITKPDAQLWSQSQIAGTGTWPRLPVGKDGRLVNCMQQRVRGEPGDRLSQNFLVVRMSDKRRITFKPYYLNRIDPYTASILR